jgi:predicted PurR-regulated permease PerM
VTGSPSCHFVSPSWLVIGLRLAPCRRVAEVPSESPPVDAAHARAREATAHYAPAEPRALGVMAVLAIAAILWILLPIGIGVLVGALLAFTLHQANRALVRRTHRPALVALGLTLAASIVVAGSLGALLYLLVLQGVAVVSELPKDLASGGPADMFIQKLVRPFGLVNTHAANVVARLRDTLGNVATHLAGWAAQMVAILFDGLLALFFMAITMYFVLRHWPSLARRAEYLMPINPHHTRRLMREVHRLGRTVVVGNFGTAIVQGTIAGVGFWIGHVPQPAFFGAITAVASLVPAFGTLLVWVPAGVFLIATGHVGAGIFELVWGSLAVVGLCDYVVRPRLVGGGETMSTWLMFVALFGGIKLFGFVGFLLGPLLVGIAIAALRLYERTRRFRLGLS